MESMISEELTIRKIAENQAALRHETAPADRFLNARDEEKLRQMGCIVGPQIGSGQFGPIFQMAILRKNSDEIHYCVGKRTTLFTDERWTKKTLVSQILRQMNNETEAVDILRQNRRNNLLCTEIFHKFYFDKHPRMYMSCYNIITISEMCHGSALDFVTRYLGWSQHRRGPHGIGHTRYQIRGMSPSDLRWVLWHIGSALEFLHNSMKQIGDDKYPIVMAHFDVHPTNILVQFNTECLIRFVLGDFGETRVFRPDETRIVGLQPQKFTMTMTQSHIVSGHELFASPQNKIGRYNALKNDIYAFGVTLLSLWVGYNQREETKQRYKYVRKALRWIDSHRLHKFHREDRFNLPENDLSERFLHTVRDMIRTDEEKRVSINDLLTFDRRYYLIDLPPASARTKFPTTNFVKLECVFQNMNVIRQHAKEVIQMENELRARVHTARQQGMVGGWEGPAK